LQAAIFDMDGTLLDSMDMWLRLVPDFMRARGLVPDPKLFEGCDSLGLTEAADCLAAGFPLLGMSPEQIRREWDETVLQAYLNEVRPIPFAVEYLKRLRGRGIRTAVATLTPHALADRALAHHGMSGLFDCILTTEDVGGVGKEHPDLFCEAARRLDAPVSGCVVFEDSLYAIKTAVAAGFRTCAIAGRRHEQAEVRRLCLGYIRDFAELLHAPDGQDILCIPACAGT
jgi:HAD superfamily hydrolase (TIGR01509 family)